MSEIYTNAVDSLKIGMEFFLKENNYSNRKHAILTLFHSIELFLKEFLYQQSPVLIYKNIDTKITEDSVTVTIKEILTRLDNLKLGLPKEQSSIIEKIQRRRNRIEHHRYDYIEEDGVTIAESLQFILFFVDEVLNKKLETDIDASLVTEIQEIIYTNRELSEIAEYRIKKWYKEKWPEWNPDEEDSPDAFSGTDDCPACGQSFLVIGHHDKPFCFRCNTSVNAMVCENCGVTYLDEEGCFYCFRHAIEVG